MPDRILIFDTTLRDGEQSPGASLNLRQKIEVAKQLEVLGVDVIEAGFPISSPGDFESVKAVAAEVKGAIVAGLARCKKGDIDAAADALKAAARPRIHVFLATSEIHMKYKLRMAEEKIRELAVAMTRYARQFSDDVEFSPEDASRTRLEFLCEVFDAVVEAGARTVNIPDTVGYAVPDEFGALIRHLRERTRNADRAVISVHCHNDLGLAVANSLAAVKQGARQVECTVNGIGERAGNCSLEEVVMTLNTRRDAFGDFTTGINTRQIMKTSRLVSHLTGIVVQPNKAIVGQNAFAHEAGIHQDGVLKDTRTYEIMKPEDIGLSESRLVLGKHSGSHAFRSRLKKMGYSLSDEELGKVFERFKALADKKKEIFDEDIEALVEEEISTVSQAFTLEYISISSGNRTIPTATIRLRRDKEILEDASCGDGPVDAACKTIDRITGVECRLLSYNLKAVTGGKDAIGEVTVRLQHGDREVSGRGASTDIIEASARAYLNAVNKILASGIAKP